MAEQRTEAEQAALPERLSVENAAEVLADLLADETAGANRSLDLSPVIRIDTAALQMLLVAKRHLSLTGDGLRFQHVGQIVLEEARLLGLDELLELS